MLKFSACIEMMYQDIPFMDRFALAAKCGVQANEIWGFARHDIEELRRSVDSSGVPLASMCVGTKDEALAAEYAAKALLCSDSGETLYKIAVDSVKFAKQLGAKSLIITTGNERNDITHFEQHANVVLALKAAAPVFEDAGITAVLEPLNILVNHRGYFLSSTYEAFAIIREVASPYVKLLYDIYHQQITDGNLIANITENIELIGHFHCADNPGRMEPGTGEINYKNIFAAIEKTAYSGYVGLEYAPSIDSSQALINVLNLAK